MIEQSIRMKDVRLSRIREIMDYCAQLEKQGRTIINLTNGEPDFVTPEYIRDAAKKALDDGITGYAPTIGVEYLRKAIARKLKTENHVEYGANEVLITNGGTQSAFLGMVTFLNPGDEVILPDPGYTIYPEIAKLAGAEIKTYSLKREKGFQIDADELKALITDKTKLILLLSPSNPVGAVLSRETLEQVAELVKGKDILVLSDEVYERLLYGGKTHFSIAEIEGMRDQTIILNSFSKTFAMTGFRVGYICANETIITNLIKLHENMTASVPISLGKRLVVLSMELPFRYSLVKPGSSRVVYQEQSFPVMLHIIMTDQSFISHACRDISVRIPVNRMFRPPACIRNLNFNNATIIILLQLFVCHVPIAQK